MTTIKWKIPQTSDNIIYMSPNEYIERVNLFNKYPLQQAEQYEREYLIKRYSSVYYPPFSQNKYNNLIRTLYSNPNTEFDIPYLEYKDNYLSNQEGFHRAIIAKHLNNKEIPVLIIGKLPQHYIFLIDIRMNNQVIKEINTINQFNDEYSPLPYINEKTGEPLDNDELTNHDAEKLNEISYCIRKVGKFYNISLDNFMNELQNFLDNSSSNKNIRDYLGQETVISIEEQETY